MSKTQGALHYTQQQGNSIANISSTYYVKVSLCFCFFLYEKRIRFRSRLFWTDWDRNGPRIETSSLDGSDRTILVEDAVEMPNTLTVDRENNRLVKKFH